MSDATEHIAGWEAAGLIDRETADRLRAASDPTADRNTPAASTTAHPRSAAAALFGPRVALLIEGLILLAVGFVADRLRRRIGRGDASKPEAPLVDVAPRDGDTHVVMNGEPL